MLTSSTDDDWEGLDWDGAHPIYHYIFRFNFLEFVQANIRTYNNSSKACINPHRLWYIVAN